jgi:hypothetical protein
VVAFPLIVKPERVPSGAHATYMVLTQVHTDITSQKSHDNFHAAVTGLDSAESCTLEGKYLDRNSCMF